MSDHPEEATQTGWDGASNEAPAKDRDNRKRDVELLATERICRIVEDDIPEQARPRVLCYLLRRYVGPGQCIAPPAGRSPIADLIAGAFNPKP